MYSYPVHGGLTWAVQALAHWAVEATINSGKFVPVDPVDVRQHPG